MKKTVISLFICLILYAGVTYKLSDFLESRPASVRLGVLPRAEVLKATMADHRLLVGEFYAVKVMVYFGEIIEQWQNRLTVPPEYYNMFKMLETAIKLDPYNMDSYYFAQAAFTWEIGRAKDVNQLLIHGMPYRHWDWYLPYFTGFNAAYFLKDYDTAAIYMQKAAELSGSTLLSRLTSRYFFEADDNQLAIAFLRSVVDREQDPKVRRAYEIRLQSLLAVQTLEDGLKQFEKRYQRPPAKLNELVDTGVLPSLPTDPYGGEFYLDETGKVRTTSSFAMKQ
jgi:tetratricopeptide (TPR) repeat protein